MDYTTLRISKIDSKFKCADVITFGGNVVALDGPGSGQIGNKRPTSVCVAGKCLACDAQRDASDGWQVLCNAGLGEPRVCSLPGVYTRVGGYLWQKEEYGYNPTWVWLAIYFPFVIIGLVTLCLILWRKKLENVGFSRLVRRGSRPLLASKEVTGYSTLSDKA